MEIEIILNKYCDKEHEISLVKVSNLRNSITVSVVDKKFLGERNEFILREHNIYLKRWFSDPLEISLLNKLIKISKEIFVEERSLVSEFI